MKIVVLSGKMRAGKSTIADYLIENHGYTRLSFAQPLKQAIADMGFDPQAIIDKPPYIRKLMVALGMARRAEDENYWIDQLNLVLANNMLDGVDKFVCDDARFMNEVQFFQHALDTEQFHVTFIRVERIYDTEAKPGLLEDESENALDRWDGFDHKLQVMSGDVGSLTEGIVNLLSLGHYEQLELPLVDPTEGGSVTTPELADLGPDQILREDDALGQMDDGGRE